MRSVGTTQKVPFAELMAFDSCMISLSEEHHQPLTFSTVANYLPAMKENTASQLRTRRETFFAESSLHSVRRVMCTTRILRRKRLQHAYASQQRTQSEEQLYYYFLPNGYIERVSRGICKIKPKGEKLLESLTCARITVFQVNQTFSTQIIISSEKL